MSDRHRLWTLYLQIKHLKSYNAAKELREACMQMCPQQKLSNNLLEPTIVSLLILINGGGSGQKVQVDQPNIGSVKQLLASDW